MANNISQGRRSSSGRPLRFTGEAAFFAHRKSAKRFDDRVFTVYAAPALDGKWRFAAVASKRLGGAVERNRAKRRLRAAFTNVKKSIPLPLGVIIYAKQDVLTLDYSKILEQLKKALNSALVSHQSS